MSDVLAVAAPRTCGGIGGSNRRVNVSRVAPATLSPGGPFGRGGPVNASRKVAWWQSVLNLANGEMVTVAHVCAVLVAASGVDGVAVTVAASLTARETLYASDAVAAELEELAQTLGDGPGADVFTAGGPVLAADMTTPDSLARWPGFAPAAANAGVRAVLALPLQVGGIRLGALNLYRKSPGGLEGGQLADALTLTDMVCLLLLASGDQPDAADRPSPPAHGWHPQVHQATGMVSVQLSVSVEVAFIRLRAHAFAQDRRLGEVAADVVARRLRFEPDSEPNREPGQDR